MSQTNEARSCMSSKIVQCTIDGVDVSGCKYLTFLNNCTMLKTCKENYCYYKQLKRTQKENEQLKDKISVLENKIEDMLEGME